MMNEKTRFKLIRECIVLCILVLVVYLSFVSYAWIAPTPKLMGSVAGVGKPDPLSIMGPDEKPLTYIDFGTADINNEEGKAQFLFCVYSNRNIQKYDLALVYTTNTSYEFRLHRAIKSPTATGTYTIEYTGQVVDGMYFYQENDINTIADENGSQKNKLILQNETSPNSRVANKNLSDHYFNWNYPNSTNDDLSLINGSSVPLVAIANFDETTDSIDGNAFAEYFVLEVSWQYANVPPNSKEVDMIYIMAKPS